LSGYPENFPTWAMPEWSIYLFIIYNAVLLIVILVTGLHGWRKRHDRRGNDN
jgi:hypothetical protein